MMIIYWFCFVRNISMNIIWSVKYKIDILCCEIVWEVWDDLWDVWDDLWDVWDDLKWNNKRKGKEHNQMTLFLMMILFLMSIGWCVAVCSFVFSWVAFHAGLQSIVKIEIKIEIDFMFLKRLFDCPYVFKTIWWKPFDENDVDSKPFDENSLMKMMLIQNHLMKTV